MYTVLIFVSVGKINKLIKKAEIKPSTNPLKEKIWQLKTNQKIRVFNFFRKLYLMFGGRKKIIIEMFNSKYQLPYMWR